jgi:CRP-like cAMP-binding protein
MFAPEDWIISDTPYEISHTKSQLFIDAIEDSEIEIIDNKLFEKLVTDSTHSNPIGLNKLLKRISVLQKRIILLMSASALERYQDFVATYPNIVQRVPQKMIASYLGITPEALSKIRSDFAKQK